MEGPPRRGEFGIDPENRGMIPRAVEMIFDEAAKLQNKVKSVMSSVSVRGGYTHFKHVT